MTPGYISVPLTRWMMLGRITDTRKTDRIVAALKAHVVDGNLESGTEFPAEKELAQQLGVSKFSLREALRFAEAQGLIEISRGRRAKVAEPSPAPAAAAISISLRRSRNTIVDLLEARHLLEAHAARVAATKISEGDIAVLERTIRAIESHPDDRDSCVEQDLKFHSVLVHATGNMVFEIMLAALAELLRESLRQSMDYSYNEVVAEHTGIVLALKARDPDLAARQVERHLEQARKRQLRTKAAPSRSRPSR
jgi:GntR family transcriptional regulator, transcriptional repressor for pyruvate dehydrogenase complex